MIAQDDKELFPWIVGANRMAGSFLKNLCEAALRADPLNYAIMRPVLLQMKEKYFEYDRDERERMRKDGYDG
jgi:hypothetical protein